MDEYSNIYWMLNKQCLYPVTYTLWLVLVTNDYAEQKVNDKAVYVLLTGADDQVDE